MRLTIRLIPTSSQNKIETLSDGTLKVWVTAPPINGAANTALIESIAKKFKVPKNTVAIIRGFKSRSKIVEIADL